MTTATRAHAVLPAVVELRDLNTITERVRRGWERPEAWLNTHGGDVACGGRRALLRHSANYAVAAHLADDGTDRDGTDNDAPIIDVGCGTGLHSRWLADTLGRPLWLVDNDPDSLAAAGALTPSARTFSDLSEVPDDAGGLVVAMEVIEHVAHPHQADMVAQLRRVARPEALVCISTPDETEYRGGHSGYGPHIGSLSPGGLQRLVDPLGEGATVWHLYGEPFALGRLERVILPTANRINAGLRKLAPGPVASISAGLATVGRLIQRSPFAEHLDDHVVARTAEAHGSTGLFAAVRTEGSRPNSSLG